MQAPRGKPNQWSAKSESQQTLQKVLEGWRRLIKDGEPAFWMGQAESLGLCSAGQSSPVPALRPGWGSVAGDPQAFTAALLAAPDFP